MKLGLARIKKDEVFSSDSDTSNQILERMRIYKFYQDECIQKTKDFNFNKFISLFNQTFQTSIEFPSQLVYFFSEDICVLDLKTLKLVFGVVCFPNRWRLNEKIGKSVLEIHDPVPEFKDVNSNFEMFIRHLKREQYYRRQNIGIAETDDLYLPYNVNVNKFYKREEFQTLFQLGDEYLVFLIQTKITSINKEEMIKIRNSFEEQMREYKFSGLRLSSKL